jgi:transcriptional regulator with XRE-family HTH domain
MTKAQSSPKRVSKEDVDIGARIRYLRMRRAMSQTDLGNRLRPRVTFQQVQKYEKGTNRISAVRLQQMAVIFGTPLEQLVPSPDAPLPNGDAFECLREADAVKMLQAYGRLPRRLREAVRHLIGLLDDQDTPSREVRRERVLEAV